MYPFRALGKTPNFLFAGRELVAVLSLGPNNRCEQCVADAESVDACRSQRELARQGAGEYAQDAARRRCP